MKNGEQFIEEAKRNTGHWKQNTDIQGNGRQISREVAKSKYYTEKRA